MAMILPPKTSGGAQLGQRLGNALSEGLQQGGQVAFQRNLTQKAMQGLQNLPKGTTPAQLATHLIQATAGIPGAERYVGQIFPLLLNQLRSDEAFGSGGQSSEGMGATIQPSGGAAPKTEGGFGNLISEQDIDREAQRYAQATGSGLEGYNQMQAKLMNQNVV